MRYAIFFVLSAAGLTAGALFTFDHISALAVASVRADTTAQPVADTLPTAEVVTPPAPTDLDYARFAAADAAWRARYARQYTLDELRARGDGKRSPRDAVRDRVFAYVQSDQRPLAIAELERWVGVHPGDAAILLSLARLLAEDGRSEDAVKRYRQILALPGGAE